jgi:hypothetical protein
MIYNIVIYSRRDTIIRFLQKWGKPLASFLKPLYYEDLPYRKQLPVGTYIFSDVERLPADMMAQAIDMAHMLEAAGNTVYNHPAKALGRYDLLENLYQDNINDFAIHRLADVQSGARLPRFPAFVRRENDHKGSMSQPVTTMEELEKIAKESLDSGIPLEDLIVVEWCDVRSDDGQFRKFSSFVVGDQFIAGTLVFSNNWVTKYPDVLNEGNIAEEREYLTANPHPHEDLVREVFRRANLQYGRIDYGVKDGKIQVWEINSNPTIVRKHNPSIRLSILIPTFEAISNAFQAIEASQTANAKPATLNGMWRKKHGINPLKNNLYPAVRSTRQLRKHSIRTFKRIPARMMWLTRKITGK